MHLVRTFYTGGAKQEGNWQHHEYKMQEYIGIKLYGYCGGLFGRQVDWGPKVIEAVGKDNDWIVVRDEQGRTWFTNEIIPSSMKTFIEFNSKSDDGHDDGN